jgi:molybdate transport system substrate-binding protein
MKKIVVSLFICVFAIFVGMAVAEPKTEITVSAAISLRNAFEEIGKIFEAGNKDAKVAFNFGASGDLMAQIKGGAPVDVFASAALKDMDVLENDGLVIKDSRVNFAGNTLVLVRPASPKVPVASFDDLRKSDVRKIAVGNPKTVPAGRYADEVFQSMKLADAIKDKLIFAENVRQVLDYVARGEVDAGVIYATDAMTRASEVAVIAVAPENHHKPVLYPIAVLKDSKHEKTARAFILFVRSDEGMKILEKYGFKPGK